MAEIKNEAEYQTALARIDELIKEETRPEDLNELEMVSLLIEKYENEHYPISAPTRQAAIKFRKDQERRRRP